MTEDIYVILSNLLKLKIPRKMVLCILSHYVLKLQRYDIVNGVVDVDGLKNEAATEQQMSIPKKVTYLPYDPT